MSGEPPGPGTPDPVASEPTGPEPGRRRPDTPEIVASRRDGVADDDTPPAALDAAVAEPWRRVAPRGVPATYPVPPVTISRLLDDAAADFPTGDAIVFRGRRLSWRHLQDLADRLATVLRHHGVGPGDRMLLALPRTPQAVVCLFGAWRAGAAAVVVEADLDADDIAGIGAAAGATLAVIDERRRQRGRLPDVVPHLLVTGPEDALPFPRNIGAMLRRSARRADARSTDRLMAQIRSHGPLPMAPDVTSGHDEVAAVILASGELRGYTHRQLLHAAFQLRLWLPDTVAGAERIISTVPLHHPVGLTCGVTMPVLSAATMVLEPATSPRRVLRAVRRTDPTVALLGDAPDVSVLGQCPTPSLRVCLLRGPRDDDVRSRTEERTGARVRGWWAPPDSAGIALADPVYGLTKPGTVGIPVTDTRAVVLDDDGGQARPDEPGWLWVAGPQLPGAGWRPSGARAAMDDDGFVTILEKAVSGGE